MERHKRRRGGEGNLDGNGGASRNEGSNEDHASEVRKIRVRLGNQEKISTIRVRVGKQEQQHRDHEAGVAMDRPLHKRRRNEEGDDDDDDAGGGYRHKEGSNLNASGVAKFRVRSGRQRSEVVMDPDVWKGSPSELLLQQVLGNLYIKDLIRMCAVSLEWNKAIRTHRTPLFLVNRSLRRRDLPWFYCSTGAEARIASAAFDPNLNKWHWLPLFPPSSNYATRKWYSFLRPFCGVGSLICWASFGSPSLYISKTFTNFIITIPNPWFISPSVAYARFLRMERAPAECGGHAVLLISLKQEHVLIQKFNYKEKSFQTEKTIAWDFARQSPTCASFYYKDGKLGFLSNVRARGRFPVIHYYDKNWTTIDIPAAVSTSLCAPHKIMEMDGHILLVALMREARKMKRVWLYVYDFARKGWELINSDLTVVCSLHFNCVGRASQLMLWVDQPKWHLYNMNKATWQVVPPCLHPTTGTEIKMCRACPVDPTLHQSLV